MLCVCWCFYVFFFFLLLLLLLFPVGITMYVMWILWVLKHKTSVYTMSIFVSIHIWCVWKCCRFFFFFLFCYTLFWRIRDNKNAIFLCSEHFSSVIFEVQKIFAFKKKKKKRIRYFIFRERRLRVEEEMLRKWIDATHISFMWQNVFFLLFSYFYQFIVTEILYVYVFFFFLLLCGSWCCVLDGTCDS